MQAERPAEPFEAQGLGFFDRLEDVIWGQLPHLFPLKPVVAGDRITYRKHWFALVREVFPALLLCAIEVALLTAFLVPVLGPALANAPWWLTGPLVVIALLPPLWFVWRYENWRNDYYIVTRDRLIDVDNAPFGVSRHVREASMAMVQNVSMTVPNPVAATFDFGDVFIETAGRHGILTFTDVHHPRQVMETISARVDEERQRRLEVDRERRRAEMLEWFDAYADVGLVAVVANPPQALPGVSFTVEWRVGGGRDVETWLIWRCVRRDGQEEGGQTAAQRGGPGNYRASLVPGGGDALEVQPVAMVDGLERRGPLIAVPIQQGTGTARS